MLETQAFLFVLSREPDGDLRQDEPYTPQETVMPPYRPAVYISYAWGDPQETDVSREDIVNQLYETLIREGYNPTATLDGITQNCPRRITILRSPATRETTFDVPINPWDRDVCSRIVAVGII